MVFKTFKKIIPSCCMYAGDGRRPVMTVNKRLNFKKMELPNRLYNECKAPYSKLVFIFPSVDMECTRAT